MIIDWQQLNQRPISIGRNGSIKTSGLSLWQQDDVVHIQPLTSRGNFANCFVSIPKSEVSNLIKSLQKFER